MCSPLLIPGRSFTFRVSFVEVHPKVPLVRLWGLPGERREEYLRLMKDIQLKVGPRLANSPGDRGGRGDGDNDGEALALGDLCLVELGGRWHRCRIVGCRSKPGQNYRVFLLDEGRTVSASSYYLARGRSELFHLPSEVMGCIVADLLPPGDFGASLKTSLRSSKSPLGSQTLNLQWAAEAIDFLGFLHGKEVSGVIRKVLISQCLVVLEVPWLLMQMRHLGLASLASTAFGTLLSAILEVPEIASVPLEPTSTLSKSPALPSAAQSKQGRVTADFFYPQLELNVTVPVVVTQISDPYRIYCQLRSLSKEIQLLSDAMYQAFEVSKGEFVEEALPTPGFPCAAHGIDGCWYRTLLLETYPADDQEDQPEAVAQVICVDYGRKEFVTKRHLRNLPVEYFRMPVVTYPCSLQGITDGGCGWTHSQINQLKTLLLGKVVQAHIEAYCPFEHIYYITLYGEDGLNLNCLYGVQAHCLAQNLLHSNQESISGLIIESESLDVSVQKEFASLSEILPTIAATPLFVVRLKAGEYHNVQVSFLQDPSEFWVQLQELKQPLCHLRRNLRDFYSLSKKLECILLEPKVGSLCCVMLKENSYHRALVTKVQGKGIVVYLVDWGNTEVVDLYKVKKLLPQFRELPAVAVRCALDNPFPGQPWNTEAVDYFRKSVLNKELMIKVLGMQGDVYIVELFDNSLMGEKNLAKIMSQRKYTKHHEVLETLQAISDKLLVGDPDSKPMRLRPVKKIIPVTDEVKHPQQHDSSASSAAEMLRNEHHSSEGTFYSSSALSGHDNSSCEIQNYSEIKAGEEQLEFGSTVDVIVTHIENPSHFWCRLFKNSHELNMLMTKIQDHCMHSVELHEWPNSVCLAKSSEDKKWYRAVIINKVHYPEEVEVAYVDYGNKKHVSLKNIRATTADFLKLKAQAFRCSLYNLIQPKHTNPFVWDKKAIETFHEFVNSGSKVSLKCIIFALAALNGTELFNIVDLITPFESACHFLIRKGLATFVHREKPLASSVQLLSYYYSTHNIKRGNEEIIYVTHINSPCFFFCQLARNADALESLTSNISKLSKMNNLQTSPNSRNLYLAKYTDNCWYRAIVTSKNDSKEVFFVDFGNTQLLKNEDLIVVPNDAYELMLLPMQAIKCSLSDIVDPPKDAIEWFEQAVLDKPLKALIVAKDPDGTLIIELYDGKMQINAKLKQSLGLQVSKEIIENTENNTLSPEYSVSMEENSERELALVDFVKPVLDGNTKSSAVFGETCQLQQKTEKEIARKFLALTDGSSKSNDDEDWKDMKCAALALTDGSSKSNDGEDWKDMKCAALALTDGSSKSSDGEDWKDMKCAALALTDGSSKSNDGEDWKDMKCAALHKKEERCDIKNKSKSVIYYSPKNICELPQKSIKSGLKSLVYVSHINNLSDFYVQLVEDEPILDSISEKINSSKTVSSLVGQQLNVGDLICANYSEDGLWYRAVIIKESTSELVEVRYIDYGNTAVVSIHKTCKLIEDCLSFPVMSIHCMLGSIKTSEIPEWTQKAVVYFSQKTSEVQMNCQFFEKVKGKWEITLSDEKDDIMVDMINSCLENKKYDLIETSGKVSLSEDILSDEHNRLSASKSFFWKTPKIGETIKAFSLVPKNPGYFWCQFTENDISSIEIKLQEAEENAKIHIDDLENGSPCLAMSSDNLFHRAVVSHIEENSLTVINIDYGTEKLVNIEVIREIPDELLIIPPQAFLCCLFGFNFEKGSWAEGINEIFCDMIADLPLDITIMDKLNYDSFEIPLFVVKLECQNISINEQMKHFWKHHDSTIANNYNLEEQIRNPEENSKSVLFETETSVCTTMTPKNSGLEDVLHCPNLLQSVDKCFGVGNRILSETSAQPFKNQIKHHFISHEIFHKGNQQPTFDAFNNETNYSVSGNRKNITDSTGLSEIQLSTCKIEYDALESQGGAEDKEILMLDSSEIKLPLDDTKSLLDFVPLRVLPQLNNAKNMPEKEKLKMPLLQPKTIEIKAYDETQKKSELHVLEPQHLEGQSAHKVKDNSSLMNENENVIVELMASEAVPLLTEKASNNTLYLQHPALSVPADNKMQSSFSEIKVKPQEFSPIEYLVEECKLGKSDKPNFTEGQTVLGKNYEEMHLSIHGSFKDNICVEKDYLTNIQLSEVDEPFIHDTEKKENICNLMGFDIGSQCMVWSGTQWYKAEILDISPEGTKVLNFSNGNEEIVNPIHVWNGIPELDSDLTQIMSKNKTDNLQPVPLAMEVEEMTQDSDDSTPTHLSCDSTESTAEQC